MSVDRENENKEISNLININEDASEFYEFAQEKAKSIEMKQTFAQLESLHKSVISNLQQIIIANGGKYEEADETFVGSARQFFGEIHAKISNDVDETLVSHLEEAEDRCLHSVQDIIEDDDISPSTKIILQKEHGALKRSHDHMKALKDNLKNAA